MSALPPALSDSKGEFPGKGDYDTWFRAFKACDDGIVYSSKGNYTMALVCYDEAIRIYPYDATFYFNKGVVLRKKNLNQEAINEFRKALEIEPEYASAWYDQGNAQEALNDLNSSVASFRNAVKFDPKHMHAWFNLGEALFLSKKYAAAREAFEKAQALPCSEQDKKDIADYLSKIERKQKAK